jgi:hypothetical protein
VLTKRWGGGNIGKSLTRRRVAERAESLDLQALRGAEKHNGIGPALSDLKKSKKGVDKSGLIVVI